MVNETETDKTEEQQEDTVDNIIAEQDLTQELVRVTRKVALKPLSETSILVATDANGIIQLDFFTKFEQDCPRKVAWGVMDVYPQRPFYVITSNASSAIIKLAKHWRIATTSPLPSEILHFITDEYSPCLQPNTPVNSINVAHCEPAPDRFQQIKKYKTVQKTDDDRLNNPDETR